MQIGGLYDLQFECKEKPLGGSDLSIYGNNANQVRAVKASPGRGYEQQEISCHNRHGNRLGVVRQTCQVGPRLVSALGLPWSGPKGHRLRGLFGAAAGRVRVGRRPGRRCSWAAPLSVCPDAVDPAWPNQKAADQLMGENPVEYQQHWN